MEKTQLIDEPDEERGEASIMTDSTEDDDQGNFAQQIAKYIWRLFWKR